MGVVDRDQQNADVVEESKMGQGTAPYAYHMSV